MYRILFSKTLSARDHMRILRSLLIFFNITALLVFAFLRLLFLSTPIDAADDFIAVLKTLGVGSVCALGIYTLLLVTECIDQVTRHRKLKPSPVVTFMSAVACSMLIFCIAGCKSPVSVGIHKDVNTGMTTTYKNLEPGKTLLVMNNEVLNHTDIPLGEDFVLINDEVKGLVVKDGKVSAGCELTIKDKNGNSILHKADLFEGKDVFPKEKAESLKCTISTGKPMNWEESYDVAVRFWDKFGNGDIENEFSIRMIDIP